MKKHLIRVGNSYALIIEKSIRNLLYLGPRSILEVSTDGTRILIEPTGQLLQDDEIGRARELLSAEIGMPRPTSPDGLSRKALDIDARGIWTELERRYYIDPQRLARLHHEPVGTTRPISRLMRVGSWMTEPNCATRANDEELAFLRRMRVCRDRLREGATWDEAIDDAVRAFPKGDATVTSGATMTAATIQAEATTLPARAAPQPQASDALVTDARVQAPGTSDALVTDGRVRALETSDALVTDGPVRATAPPV
ncbi:MAG TPA: AbrB/MazE/SpoVT family DNA-binding domain-containing protein [Kofleriaceae bacterium]|nr:AbrB/MazE/SpoVT family DNA-binding domain-containing protein [Kofleriaceae bacterium]